MNELFIGVPDPSCQKRTSETYRACVEQRIADEIDAIAHEQDQCVNYWSSGRALH
jgi:hypothetical protein